MKKKLAAVGYLKLFRDLKLAPMINKVSKVAKIRNRYNQVPHLTQDTNGKVTNSQKIKTYRSASCHQVLKIRECYIC